MNLTRFVKKRVDNFNWKQKESPRLAKFKNIHQGEDCFLIGNGPSLNKMDLTLLNKYYTFGLNKIFLIFKRVNLQLSYHVSVNKYVIQQSLDPFQLLTCPSFLDYTVSKGLLPESERIYYVNTRAPKGFYGDISSSIAQGGTVTYIAMQIAYSMGFSRVFLVGVDHTFAQKGKPNELQEMKEDDVNHFDPNYFKGQKWQLADLDESERSYLMARQYFEKNNRQVLDATVGGQLQIFDKISFEDAIKIAKKK